MIENLNICPYTGLRSFTEDESLYFKGRDLQIDQISSLLEKNKFLMVTGASGEGKSSLIYAGLVPNARAGFFKAKYSNWVIADFRPERNPVKNMAKALALKLGHSEATVETELRRGFSSLIDLYTNSDYYLPDDQLENASADRKRKSANLMILVDQFEEFFTNPENFYNEAPSQDSQIVVNLVLETARIALAKNIPVYIVCTMRSDYIGQCTAFRGLPEYIGFSQFFVPRLKRKDLKQVIEEPAQLSGNKISQRLIERVVYDLADGIDQLPILQHAMSQIWLAADHGIEEMDLIHYAMVGGMPASELPDSDLPKFKNWLSRQPEYRKKYYEVTGLQKIIEIHASLLYESAWEMSSQKLATSISQQEAKRIIAIAFACLTKIDNSRAVRNRMTLQEITDIVNEPDLNTEVVGSVLDIFRAEGNSFIRPFKTDDPNSDTLKPESVLDITHESLIRNWGKLNTWAQKEFEFHSTYLDFKKQLDRWKNSGKSLNYLLPIGPLTYFEKWYVECRPNQGWIKRYSEVIEHEEQANEQAAVVLADTKDFIKRSANKVIITRTFMKYGPQRVATFFAIVAMIFLSGFYWYDAEQKQNDLVIKRLQKETAQLVASNEVGNNIKATSLLISERLDSGYLNSYLNRLDPKQEIGLANEAYKIILEFSKKDRTLLKASIINRLETELAKALESETDIAFVASELNKFTAALTYDEYYNPSTETKSSLTNVANMGFNLVLKSFVGKKNVQATLSTELNYTLQNWLTFGAVSENKLEQIVKVISPLAGAEAQQSFSTFYPKGSYEINGRIPNDYNGGYHTLASLYAALGQVNNVIWCFNQMKETGQNDYFTGSLFNNYNHILGILYQFGHQNKSQPMIDWLSKNYESDTPITIYRNSFIRSGYMSHLYRVNIEKDIHRSYKGYFFPNLCLADRSVSNALADSYDQEILKITNADERNYLLALSYKRKAMFTAKYNYDREQPLDNNLINGWLDKYVEHYRKISPSFLEETVPTTIPYFGDGVRSRQYKRRYLMLYPDYMDGWFSWTYHSDVLFNYMNDRNLFMELYTKPEDFDALHFWIAKANEKKAFYSVGTFDNNIKLPNKVYEAILHIADEHPQGKNFDRNLTYLILANRQFEENGPEKGLRYYSLFDQKSISRSADKYEYVEKTFFLNQMKDLCVNLANHGFYKEGEELAEKFEKEHEKVFAYIFMADKIFQDRGDPKTFVYLDSAFSKAKPIDLSQFTFGAFTNLDFQFQMLMVLGRIGGEELNQKALDMYTEMVEGSKTNALVAMNTGIGDEGNLHRAAEAIPSTLTETEDLICRSIILWQAARKRDQGSDRWRDMDNFFLSDWYYIFYLPN